MGIFLPPNSLIYLLVTYKMGNGEIVSLGKSVLFELAKVAEKIEE